MATPTRVLMTLLETAQRPGMMSLAGKRRERLCRKDLERYFRRLKVEVLKLHLEDLVDSQTAETAAHAAEMKIRPVLRGLTAVLLGVLATNLYPAYQEGAKVADQYRRLHFKEADPQDPPATPAEVTKALQALQPVPGFSDGLGVTGEQAVEYAAERSALQVVGLNATTLEKLQGVIANGIEEMIAVTEMADAFSQSALDSMRGFGVEYKRWVVAPDCCDECLDLDDEVVGIDESFSEGVDAPPLHPNCRCAIVPARAPDGEGDTVN